MKRTDSNWSLEIVPRHVKYLDLIPKAVKEIYVVMIPESDVQKVVVASKVILHHDKIPVPHIAARNIRSEKEFSMLLSNLEKIGTKRVLLIAGGSDKAIGPYHCVMDLLKTHMLEKYGFQQIDIAGHPEGNPYDTNTDKSLLEKLLWATNQGVNTRIITQWCFDPVVINSWVCRMREHDIENSIHIGIPGPATIKTLLRYARICGVKASKLVLKKYGFSLTKLFFLNRPDNIVNELKEYDGLHLYPFGGLSESSKWLTRAQL